MKMVEITSARYEEPENILKLVRELRKGAGAAYNWKIKDLVNVLKTADQAYYNDGNILKTKTREEFQTIVTDAIYDELVDILREKKPDHSYLKKVGAEINKNASTSHASQRMVQLPFPMASLDKLKPDNAETWLSKVKEIVVSDKVDGVSFGITSDGKGNIKLVSRGNGTTGQDLSYLIKSIPSLKPIIKNKDKKFAIRGELVFHNQDFLDKYTGKYKNPRNMMSGILNAGEVSPAFKDAKFIGYSVIEPNLKPVDAFKFLDKLGVITPNWEVIKNPSVASLTENLVNRKSKSLYDMDGLVITDTSKIESPSNSNPKSSKAFKIDAEEANTKVIDVIWNVGKTGSIIPKIVIEPVKLSGVTIRQATAHNAKFLYDMKIGKGAIITVTRAGEVIPKILKVIKSAKKADMPDNLPYIWKGVHIVLDDSKEGAESSVKQRDIKRISFFYRTLGVESVSEGLFEKLYDNGFNTIFKVAKITVNDLLNLDGFQKVLANKVYKAIHDSLQEVQLVDIMYGSSCFDRTLGSKRIFAIISSIPNFLLLTDKELIAKIPNLEGFQETTAKAFVSGLPLFKKFLSKIEKLVGNIILPKKKVNNVSNSNSKLANQVIVFTGFRDKELSKIIEDNGGTEGSSVSRKTSILVVKDKSSSSSKTKKAQELGVKIMDIPEFKTWLSKAIK